MLSAFGRDKRGHKYIGNKTWMPKHPTAASISVFIICKSCAAAEHCNNANKFSGLNYICYILWQTNT
jgi:hypothetical protein